MIASLVASFVSSAIIGAGVALVIIQVRWIRIRKAETQAQLDEFERRLAEEMQKHGPIVAVEPAPALIPEPEPRELTRREKKRLEKDLRALLDELED